MMQSKASLYEGLFLLNQKSIAADFNAGIEHLREIFDRAGATVVAMKKWGERRLAYEIKRQTRGTFILVYFNGPREQIISIERDCNLSETVLRFMIIRAEHIGETELELIKKEDDLALEAKLHSDLSTPVKTSSSVGSPGEAATADA